MTDEDKALEGEVISPEEENEWEKVYEELSVAIGGCIAAQSNGKNISVYMPILDALSRNVVATLMMLPEDVREPTLVTFFQRTKTFYLEAKRLETEPVGSQSRIITLN